MLFHEEQQAGNRGLLRLLGSAKGVPADMDVQAAGGGLMGAVAHRNCRVHHLLPREAVHMAVQRGRVADDLEALIQTAIMLAVHTWFGVIADGKNFVRVAVVFPSSVDFQLHAEIARSHAVENRQRLVIIAVDTALPKLLVAALTIRIIFIAVVQITGIVIQKQPPTALTGRVGAVIAPLAERVIVRPGIGIIPEPGPAVGTDNRFFVKAVFAEINSCNILQQLVQNHQSERKRATMNVRKPVDYGTMYREFATILAQTLPQMDEIYAIGKAISQCTEKGAAVAAAEFLQANFPDRTGFSPRNVRRMRDFYRTYENDQRLLRLAMKIGWTLNVVIMEAELTRDAHKWYLEQAREQQWSKKNCWTFSAATMNRIWKQIKITPLCVFLRAVVK